MRTLQRPVLFLLVGCAISGHEPGDFDPDGDEVSWPTDCDSSDASIHPDAPEICDGKDNDCDESVDEETDSFTVYADSDGDGFGDSEDSLDLCEAMSGYTNDDTDCDDTDATVHPGAEEVFNDGLDQDCDGRDLATWEGDVGSELELESLCEEGAYLLLEGSIELTKTSKEDLSALWCVVEISGDLTMYGNLRLQALSGLENLTSVGRSLTSYSNDALGDLSGLEGLASVGDDLNIHNNYGLRDLSGLEGLAAVGRDLYIGDNDGLVDLRGLEGLAAVGEDLYIGGNDILSDVTALHEVSAVGAHLTVTDHPCLETSAAEALRDAIGAANIGGDTTIAGNGGPC